MLRSKSSLAVALCVLALLSVAGSAAAQPLPTEPYPALSVPLLAGKSTRVGLVKVRVEGADLVVEYALDSAWSLNEAGRRRAARR